MTNQPPIAWHCLLGEVLEKLLSPVGLLVYTELPVMNKPPKADILIIRREQTHWTESQRQRLPDGLRDSPASHLLLEFKYTESLTGKASQQALAYDYFYKQIHELNDSDVQTVLLCAKQPQADHLIKYGYLKTSLPGVYQSDWHSWLPPVLLLSLNELSDAPHNAFVKCFASKRKQKLKAFEVLWQFFTRVNFPEPLVLFLDTLWKHWFPGGNMKESTLTLEDFSKLSPHWRRLMLETLSVEDLLTRFRIEDLFALFMSKGMLSQLKPEDLLAQFKPADVLAQFKPEDLLAQFKPADVLAQFKPEDLLAQFKPADLLAQVKPEDIENYLAQLKQSSRPTTTKAKTKKKG